MPRTPAIAYGPTCIQRRPRGKGRLANRTYINADRHQNGNRMPVHAGWTYGCLLVLPWWPTPPLPRGNFPLNKGEGGGRWFGFRVLKMFACGALNP